MSRCGRKRHGPPATGSSSTSSPPCRSRLRDARGRVVKPPPFQYHRATTLAEATALLGELGEDGRVLAGGQSLVPLMNFRLAQPEHLVDLNPVEELAYIR